MAFLGLGEFPTKRCDTPPLQTIRAISAYCELAADAGQEAEGLALQLSLLIEGAMQAEQMKRGSGAFKYAKKASKILIDSAPKN